MADSMKFGPEWLRALVDGSQSSGTPAPPSTKFKLAEYRYGREEMLTLYQNLYEAPSVLKKFPHIFVEETQTPIALMPLSEDEQRLIAQGVNSQMVMRPGRGAQTATRGVRVGLVERGRARGGRGRGEVYSRGGLENGDIGGGGFSRPRGPNKDGWEEVGNRKLERVFSRPFDDGSREGHPRFSRSMSDNWRDKGPADEEDEGDWRKPANKERWNTRTNWREPGRGGHDFERREGAAFLRNRAFEAEDRGRRMGEPRDSEDVPEWIDDGTEDVGSFDASGAFVSNREHPYSRDKRDDRDDSYQGSADPPLTDHHDGQARGPQQQDGWESSDDSEDIHQTSNDIGSQGHGSQVSREDPEFATAAVEEENEASNGGLTSVAAISGTLSPLVPDVVPNETAAEEEKPKISAPVVPMAHENGLKWYYVDPQENLQGPFASEDMAQWFSAGYFTMCLKVKRGCDHHFQPLGDLMKQWGHVPFVPGPIHPPIVKSMTTLSQETVTASTTSPLATTTTTHPAVVSLPLPASAPAAAAPAPTPGPAPAPPSLSLSLGQGAGGTESLLMQQQLLLQHQILQLEVELRQLQMQTLSQLQEQDSFKVLDPSQQQQVSMHLIQSNPLLQQRMQHLQQLRHMQQQTQQTQQQLQLLSSQGAGLPAPAPLGSAASSSVAVASSASVTPLPPQLPPQQQQQSQPVPSAAEITRSSSSPSFSLPVSQPPSTGEGQGDIPSIWGSAPPAGGWPPAQPTSVWEVENSLPPPAVKADLEKMRKEKEEFVRMIEAERKQQEEIQKQQEELRRQAEALQREREQMEREKEEMERQRILELQRVEELRRQQEEEQRRRELEEAQRRKMEEEEARRKIAEEQQRRREEEEMQRRKEEEQRKREEERREEEKRKLEEEEWRKQEELRRKREAEEVALQEMKRMEEVRQQQEAERQRQREMDKQQEAEAAQKKKELERQQQEALRRMQQQQALQNIQLPSSANWARQQNQGGQSVQSRSLAEIQQEEELRQLQQQRERQQMQRLQEEQQQLQQQQQQTQKTWASNIATQQPSQVKTLAEIQEEQERQLRQEKQKVQQLQTYQAKAMSLSQAAVWGSGPGLANTQSTTSSSSSSSTFSSTPWTGTNSIWGAPAASSIWGNGTPAPSHKSSGKKAAKDSSNSSQTSSEFPSLHSQKSTNKSKQAAARTAVTTNSAPPPSKSKKEEEAVQRLFRETSDQIKDEFTMWCEAFLEGMEVQVDIETFVSFLKEVDSPYEVHDYVKSYLGESKKAREFGKLFLEKRSHFNNKARKEKRQEEESIWGPAPAVNPREIRGNTVQTSNMDHGGLTEVGGKSKGAKKKKKMQKMDGSALLGFTVAKDPNRKNAGEIESID